VTAKVHGDLERGIVDEFAEFVVLVHLPEVLVHAESETTNCASLESRLVDSSVMSSES
jgi:hypothetical protein